MQKVLPLRIKKAHTLIDSYVELHSHCILSTDSKHIEKRFKNLRVSGGVRSFDCLFVCLFDMQIS